MTTGRKTLFLIKIRISPKRWLDGPLGDSVTRLPT